MLFLHFSTQVIPEALFLAESTYCMKNSNDNPLNKTLNVITGNKPHRSPDTHIPIKEAK